MERIKRELRGSEGVDSKVLDGKVERYVHTIKKLVCMSFTIWSK